MEVGSGYVTVITGATRGIGRAVATELAGPGSRLVLSGRSTTNRPDKRLPGTLEEIVEQCRQRGSEVLAVPADLASPDGTQQIINATDAHFGRCDILINNAAISYLGKFVDVVPASFNKTLQVNLLAPVALTHAFLPGMLDRGFGRVLFIGSGAAHHDGVLQLPYSVSKIGLERLTTGLDFQLAGTGVTASCVRIDELVVTEAVHLSAPQLVTEDSMQPDRFAIAVRWMIDHGEEIHGKTIDIAYLRHRHVL
jgi:NAD(P)-dependent dehydrogenase (short-subunit alcohol dehydrogenase family)